MNLLETFLKTHYSKATEPLLLERLWDAPKALLLGFLQKNTDRSILVITGERREGQLAADLDYFARGSVYEFPSWETLPEEEIAPSPDIVGRRLQILYHLTEKKGQKLVLAPLQACLQKVPSIQKLRPVCNFWKVKEEIPFDALPEFLSALGYRREVVVSDKGQFALRGGILDIFPLSSPDPYRVEFFGDEIESIRTFDPIGQKSIDKIDSIFLCPASEQQLVKEDPHPAFLHEYLGKDPLIIFDDLAALEDTYVTLKSLPAAEKLSISALLEATKNHPRQYWIKETIEELSEVRGKENLTFEMFQQPFSAKKFAHPFLPIPTFFDAEEDIIPSLRGFQGELHLVTATQSEEKTLKTQIEQAGVNLPEQTYFERAYLSSGLATSDGTLAILPMTEITGRTRVRRRKWRGTYHTPAAEFHELTPGDIVVHFHNGIGKYLGVEKQKNHLGVEAEFMVIEYASEGKLFVPIASSHLVSRYIGSKEEIPTLSQLGTKKWQNMRAAAQQSIVGYAEDMLHMHAERELQGGFVYREDSDEMIQFEADFPFVETDDQLSAIASLKQDMMSEKAMDRLICGDVGYGKTEVAMRAAFKAVADGKKQVAVLVPTTVLAMQHYENFKERMANFPINIGVVSRFVSPKQVKETLEKTRSGQIDILIGTHRVISKDVHFQDLGLIIIDEEQRFGVRAKETLKKFKAGVDCLTMSATPIPRTLYLSLIGARDVSVINTPPQDRLPIKSAIAERHPELIQNALLRELSREGQAYFIHNRVETIDKVAEELQKLVPDARIVVGHGQMGADALDVVYHTFKKGEADILVATTIVENGIDIPTANTILIDRSDQFGLADLYQLRGRVGRWNRPAYAYFLVPASRELAELSQKRLSALVEASGYGGGVKIAMRDLEIRGAGDILGVKQSGQISSIGFHLYCKLLKRTIAALKKKKSPSFVETKLEFSFDACLPEVYIGEPSLRMEIYHRLGEATSLSDIASILDELKDRFGAPPSPVIWLYHLTRLRVIAQDKGFSLLKFERFTFTLEKMRGKKSLRHSFPLPKTTDPELLEKEVSKVLI